MMSWKMKLFKYILKITWALIILMKGCHMTQNVTWSEAKLACVTNGTRLITLPVTVAERQVALQEMLKGQLSTVWVDFKTKSKIMWINQTKFGKPISQVTGECGSIRDKKIYLMKCNTERYFVCGQDKILGTVHFGFYCSSVKMSWHDAKEHCESRSMQLLMDTNLKVCKENNEGYWVGFHVFTNILLPATQIKGSKDKSRVKKYILEECKLDGQNTGQSCGVIQQAGQYTKCLRVPCYDRYPHLCRAQEIPKSITNKEPGNNLIIAVTVGTAIIGIINIIGFVISCRWQCHRERPAGKLVDEHPPSAGQLRVNSGDSAQQEPGLEFSLVSPGSEYSHPNEENTQSEDANVESLGTRHFDMYIAPVSWNGGNGDEEDRRFRIYSSVVELASYGNEQNRRASRHGSALGLTSFTSSPKTDDGCSLPTYLTLTSADESAPEFQTEFT